MPRTQVSFATCNLYNLNEPGLRMYRDENGWSQEEYEKKLSWTAQVIKSVPADVWAFQELWHAGSSEKVFSTAIFSDEHTLLVPPNHAGQRIVCAGAVRSKILVGEPEWIETFPEYFRLNSGGDDDQTSNIAVHIDRFSRPVLHFEIKPRLNGRRIHVYVCHFKSKGPTKIFREPWYSAAVYSKHSEAIGAAISTIRRTAEATALRLILTERMKGTNTPFEYRPA